VRTVGFPRTATDGPPVACSGLTRAAESSIPYTRLPGLGDAPGQGSRGRRGALMTGAGRLVRRGAGLTSAASSDLSGGQSCACRGSVIDMYLPRTCTGYAPDHGATRCLVG
jgi:hypothetical protein